MGLLDLFSRKRKGSILLAPFLIVGLGNPGLDYTSTRHNVGFRVVDTLVQILAAPPFQKKFQGVYTEKTIHQIKCYILKPLTYMNLSGMSVGEMMRYYKIPLDHILVIHDDIDLPEGELRLKKGGGDAGHNGLKSITQHVGGDYWRLRIGIGHPGRPEKVTVHVLGKFTIDEEIYVSHASDIISEYLPLFLEGQTSLFIQKIQAALKASQH